MKPDEEGTTGDCCPIFGVNTEVRSGVGSAGALVATTLVLNTGTCDVGANTVEAPELVSELPLVELT